MVKLYLWYIFTSVLGLFSIGELLFDCPEPVAYGDSATLICSNLNQGSSSIKNPADKQVANCVHDTCNFFDEKINTSSIDGHKTLLTVHRVNETDGGKWTCVSGKEEAICSLNVYKLPSCEISSTTSTSNLTIGQDLILKIILSNYYCTNSIAWNLQIGGKSQNISQFQEREETEKITKKAVTYSPTVTSSFTGTVKLTFNCNDETYDVNCIGVEELKLRDPPSCHVTSINDTGDLTIGNKLTLEAAIEEYHCASGIEYALLSGSVMVTEFIRRDSLFYATFEVRPVYLNKQLYLKFTCNNVSATTRTLGVEILLRKEGFLKYWIKLVTGLIAGFVVIAVLFGIIFCRNRRHRRSSSNEVSVYNIPTSYNDNEDRYQELIRVVTPNQVQDVDYLTPQPPPDTQNLQNVEYEII